MRFPGDVDLEILSKLRIWNAK